MTAPEVLAIIPARGGSKGLPRKNLAPLAGRPLLAWSIDAARGARHVSRCIVSSDDDEILAVASACGAQTHRRTAANATDAATSAAVVNEVLDDLLPDRPDIVMLLQPTSPLRNATHVDAALDLLLASTADAVIGVHVPRQHPLKALRLDADGFLRGLVDDRQPFMPRQELPTALQPNGAIYAIRHDAFRASGFLPARTLPFIMTERDSLDIDDAADLRVAEMRLAGVA